MAASGPSGAIAAEGATRRGVGAFPYPTPEVSVARQWSDEDRVAFSKDTDEFWAPLGCCVRWTARS